MADYPSAIPVISDEVGDPTDPTNSPSLSSWATHISAEVEAIAAELGTSPSAAYSTVKDRLDALQALDADLTDLASRWSAASASGPAQLAFREDTDNGTNQAVVKAPASMASDRTITLPDETGTLATETTAKYEVFAIAVGDETTAITTGTGKITFRMPYAMAVTAVRGSLTTAQSSGSIFTVDINEAGTSILSTKLTIDNTEKTSTTAATAPVISDSSLADDAEMTIDVDQVGDGTAKGLKIYLIGTRA